MIEKIILSEYTYIIIDLFLGSLMAFFSIVAYGKTKKISVLFFVISALCLYLEMVFRILERVNVYILKNIEYFGIPILQYMLNDLPYVFIIIGFLLLIKEKK